MRAVEIGNAMFGKGKVEPEKKSPASREHVHVRLAIPVLVLTIMGRLG